MAQFEPLVADLEEAHAQLVFIAGQKRHGLWNPTRFIEKHPVSFPLLLDEDRRVIKAYGLFHAIGKDAFRVAHPATLMVDRGGVVRYIYRGEGQHDRAPLEEVMRAVRSLAE
jgi:peroxiredoxin